MAKATPTDAPAAEPAPSPVTEAAQPRPRRSGALVGGIIVAGVVAAVLVFGGGVVVGLNLPFDDGQPGISEEGLAGPDGTPRFDRDPRGPRPPLHRPGDGPRAEHRDSDSDSESDTDSETDTETDSETEAE